MTEEQAREQRNALLAATDYKLLPDLNLSEGEVLLLTEYRQALRDVTAQEGFPETVVFPVDPFIPTVEETEDTPTA